MKVLHSLLVSVFFVSTASCLTPAFAAGSGQDLPENTLVKLTSDKSKAPVSCKKQCEIDRNQCKLDSKTPGNPTIKECIQIFNECKRKCTSLNR